MKKVFLIFLFCLYVISFYGPSFSWAQKNAHLSEFWDKDEYLIFNVTKSENFLNPAYLFFEKNDSLFHDRDVRKAIGYCLRARIVRKYEKQGISNALQVASFLEDNPVKAKITLMHRGWQDSDNDGILNKNRKNFIVGIVVNMNDYSGFLAANRVRKNLENIGVKAKFVLYDNPIIRDDFLAEDQSYIFISSSQ